MKFYRFVSGTAFGSLLTIGGALVVAEYQIRSGIQKRDSITSRVRAFFRSVSGEQVDSMENSIARMLMYQGILILELLKDKDGVIQELMNNKDGVILELLKKKDGGTGGRKSDIERPTVLVKSSGLNLKTPMLPFFSPRGDWEKQKQRFIQQSLIDKCLPRAYDKLSGYKLPTTPSSKYNISLPNPIFKSKDEFVPCPYEETIYNKYTGVVSSLFNQLGQVVSVGVCRDLSTRRSLGYGYVNYANLQDAYLRKMFGEFGPITGVVVMRDGDAKSKCFGFVNFEDAEDAARSIEALIGQKFDLREWYVGKAQKKSEREQALKGQFEQTVKEAVDKSQGLNLYIKNLEDTIGDDKLMEMFSQFGTITSCKVMLDPNGTSKGSGFVAFSTPEEAPKALSEMNGKMVANKPLYVALAQRKEDRRARLQAQFSQMRPIAMAPSVAPCMPMFPLGGPGLGQQVFHGQAPPAFIPPQPGFGYQQQLVPAMRPGGAPVQNFFVPMGGKQGQHPGGRHSGAVPGQQGQQPVRLMQHQMLPRGRLYRYPPGRGLPDVSMPGMGGGMRLHGDVGGMSKPFPIGAMASALANSTPAEQRTVCILADFFL